MSDVQIPLDHTAQVTAATDLSACRSTPEVHEVLRKILVEQSATVLDETGLGFVLDALTNPIAYALSQSRQEGRLAGDFDARQSVADALGLGPLQPRAGGVT